MQRAAGHAREGRSTQRWSERSSRQLTFPPPSALAVEFSGSNTGGNIVVMAVKRFSVSFDDDLATEAQASAAAFGEPFSAWLAEAAARRLRQDALLAAVADFESEHGPLSARERADSRRRLGVRPTKAKSRRKIA